MAVRQLSKDKYQLVVDYYDAAGKRKRHTKVVKCSGKKEAKKLLDEYESQLNLGFAVDLTVSDLIRDYIDIKQIKGIKRTTIQGYESYKKRIDAELGDYRAIDLNSIHVERFIIKCIKERGNKPKTVKNIISLLDGAYDMAKRKKLLPENPCEYIDLPKMIRPDINILTEKEVYEFCSSLDNEPHDFKVVCELALFCGLRRSEILGLRIRDINMTFKTIRIEQTRHRIGYEDVVQTPKTEKSRRTLSVPPFVMADIEELIREHEVYSDCEYLIQYMGEPMKPDYARHTLVKFIKKNDLPDVTLHGLRHTYASMLNASGEFDIAEISANLGHSNISTTMNIYVDVFVGISRSSQRISDSIEKKFGKNGAKMAHEESSNPATPAVSTG